MRFEAVEGAGLLVNRALYEREIPATWDNVRQIYLRRSRVQEVVSLWVAQGAQHAEPPEVAVGLKGAYVRVCTVGGKGSKGFDSEGKYHLLQVLETSVSKGVVTLQLECLSEVVRLELLSDGLPTRAELAELQEHINQRKLSALSEGCLRDTLTRLALLFHAQLLPRQKMAAAPGGAEAVMQALRKELKATVQEKRRRALIGTAEKLSVGGAKRLRINRKNGTKRPQPAAVKLAAPTIDRPMRAVRLSREQNANATGAGDGTAALDYGHASAVKAEGASRPTEAFEQHAPWTERQPLQRFMKVRKMVSLAELMRNAPQASLTPEQSPLQAATQLDTQSFAKKRRVQAM